MVAQREVVAQEYVVAQVDVVAQRGCGGSVGSMSTGDATSYRKAVQ
jgi:hypothetical protein